MAGYDDTYRMIINALMGRPNGTEIQPDEQQAYEINMLNYIRSLELLANAPFIGVAEATTQPVQPDDSRACYIAGVAQDRAVTFQNFIDYQGNPIAIQAGEMEAFLVILIWNGAYWSAESVPTNIISYAEQANFYYSFSIRKTYGSVEAMNDDSVKPLGDDGRYIKIGEIVSVVNPSDNTENGVYSYTGSGWQFQSKTVFQFPMNSNISSIEELDGCGEPGAYSVTLPDDHPVIGNSYFSLLVLDANDDAQLFQVAFVYVGEENQNYSIFMRGGETNSWSEWEKMTTDILNILTSDRTDAALSAAMGKKLNDETMNKPQGNSSQYVRGDGNIGNFDTALSDTSVVPVQNKVVKAALDEKQPTLVSGTNIKTINGQSVLGEGDIEIEGGGGTAAVMFELDFTALSFPDSIDGYPFPIGDFAAIGLTSEVQTAILEGKLCIAKITLQGGKIEYAVATMHAYNIDQDDGMIWQFTAPVYTYRITRRDYNQDGEVNEWVLYRMHSNGYTIVLPLAADFFSTFENVISTFNLKRGDILRFDATTADITNIPESGIGIMCYDGEKYTFILYAVTADTFNIYAINYSDGWAGGWKKATNKGTELAAVMDITDFNDIPDNPERKGNIQTYSVSADAANKPDLTGTLTAVMQSANSTDNVLIVFSSDLNKMAMRYGRTNIWGDWRYINLALVSPAVNIDNLTQAIALVPNRGDIAPVCLMSNCVSKPDGLFYGYGYIKHFEVEAPDGNELYFLTIHYANQNLKYLSAGIIGVGTTTNATWGEWTSGVNNTWNNF